VEFWVGSNTDSEIVAVGFADVGYECCGGGKAVLTRVPGGGLLALRRVAAEGKDVLVAASSCLLMVSCR
jgi:hypothetical protein